MKKRSNDFEWPEYKSDKLRIRAYSNKFKNSTIAEAFSKVYNVKLASDIGNNTPKELNVGDVISARIVNIGKDHVEFDTSMFKTVVVSNCNLYKYEKLRNYIPTFNIDVRVVNKTKDRATVDIIQPMVDSFVIPRTETPWIQKDVNELVPVVVKNLQHIREGFIGKAVIPNVSDFIGQDYEVHAFIPGSQIVLNITKDFDSFEGKTVNAFIINHTHRAGSNKMSLVCSVKEYLKTLGELKMVELFKNWTEDNEEWKQTSETSYNGIITGTINNTKRFGDNVITKCGVFVEIPELNITGMVNVEPEMIGNYKSGMTTVVKIDGFEEVLKFNPIAQQMQHVDPYVIEDGKLKKCNLKPILRFVI